MIGFWESKKCKENSVHCLSAKLMGTAPFNSGYFSHMFQVYFANDLVAILKKSILKNLNTQKCANCKSFK